MVFSWFYQWLWNAQATHSLYGYSVNLISVPDLLNWRATHKQHDKLDGCSDGIRQSCQWFWSAQKLERKLTAWMSVQPILSVVLICSITRDLLTIWMGVQPILLVVLIHSNTGQRLTPWVGVQTISLVVLINSNTEKGTHKLEQCSGDLVSGSDVFNTEVGLTSWIHVQPISSVILICASDSHAG